MSPAAQFAQWLQNEHPDIYARLYAMRVNQRLSGLGDDGDFTDPGLQDVSTNAVDAVNVVDSPDLASSDSGGIGTGILSSLESVGQWLISPQGLTAIATVGTTVLKVQQAQQTAQMQQAVIQANAQRAATGQPTVPITYATNAQGAVVPVYDTSTLQMMPPDLETAVQQGRAHEVTLPNGSIGYEVDQPTLTSLLNSTGIPWYGWLVAVGLLLALT